MYYRMSMQCLAVTGQIVAGFALVAQVEDATRMEEELRQLQALQAAQHQIAELQARLHEAENGTRDTQTEAGEE